MRHALRANNRRNNAATRGERREPEHALAKTVTLERFPGYKWIENTRIFETSKVLWNVLAYFKEKFERQFRITAK